MKKKYSKYRILNGFDQKSKAEKYIETLTGVDKKTLSIKARVFPSPDKKRYYVRELVRKGTKCVG
tara:strand:- start:470 stop:664 length:195 start_codon:yes stop_codon:yes gene_type:complete